MSYSCPISLFSKILLAPFCPLTKTLFRNLFRISVYGLENLPKDNCIVASNHRSYLDPPILNSVFPKHLIFLAKEELFRPPFGYLLPHLGALPIRRGVGDTKALESLMELLNKGCSVCIFPEGTRAKSGEFLKPKLGVGYIAIKTKKPVVPVYLHGSDEVLPRGRLFPSFGKRISVLIGKPKAYASFDDDPKGYKEVSNLIMEEIKSLANAIIKQGGSDV
ncbi:MAG: lysophospholipid acyltransferase family protein [Aquificaceae bacterium]